MKIKTKRYHWTIPTRKTYRITFIPSHRTTKQTTTRWTIIYVKMRHKILLLINSKLQKTVQYPFFHSSQRNNFLFSWIRRHSIIFLFHASFTKIQIILQNGSKTQSTLHRVILCLKLSFEPMWISNKFSAWNLIN